MSEDKITHDNISLGWRDDEKHYRLLLLIKGGKVVHSEERSDDWIVSNFGKHNQNLPVIEYNIIDWAENRKSVLEAKLKQGE